MNRYQLLSIILALTTMFLLTSPKYAYAQNGDETAIISNVLSGTCRVVGPVIEVIQGYDGRILPESVGINVPYESKINLNLAEGTIEDIYLVLRFNSSEIIFEADDVWAQICKSPDDTCTYGNFSENCIVDPGTGDLICRHLIGELTGTENYYWLKITIVESKWAGKSFNYSLTLEVS